MFAGRYNLTKYIFHKMSNNCLLCWCLGIFFILYLNNNKCINYGGGCDLGSLVFEDKVLATKTLTTTIVWQKYRLLACVIINSIFFHCFVRWFNCDCQHGAV